MYQRQKDVLELFAKLYTLLPRSGIRTYGVLNQARFFIIHHEHFIMISLMLVLPGKRSHTVSQEMYEAKSQHASVRSKRCGIFIPLDPTGPTYSKASKAYISPQAIPGSQLRRYVPSSAILFTHEQRKRTAHRVEDALCSTGDDSLPHV